MWVSSFALCGMLNNGKKTDWASHCIQHPLSALYDVAHGAGLSVVHPAYLEYICPEAAPRLARLACGYGTWTRRAGPRWRRPGKGCGGLRISSGGSWGRRLPCPSWASLPTASPVWPRGRT